MVSACDLGKYLVNAFYSIILILLYIYYDAHKTTLVCNVAAA